MEKKSSVVVTASLLFLLSACSGGGGGDPASTGGTTPPVALSVSGIAAAGGIIIGSVTIKDSSVPPEEKLVAISTDGSYTFDVSDMTAPFMMRADGTVGGTSYSIYSAATSADVNGTVNITPLTDLIVANIAGQLAQTYFSAENFSGLTTTALNSAETALQARLQPVLTAIGLADSIDLLRTSFNPDHTGLDAALDVLRVTTDTATGIATITNVIDNIAITDNLASQADADILAATSNVASGLSDFQQIVAKFATLTGYFATSLPAPTNTGLNALFDGTNFLFEGSNLSAFLTDITTIPTLIGAQFTDITLDTINSTTARVGFVIKYSGKTAPFQWQMNKSASDWLMAGDQQIGYVSVNSFSTYDDSTTIRTGLWLEASDFNTTSVSYAVITGNGLPTATGGANGSSSGSLLFKNISSEGFQLAASGAAYNGSSTNPAQVCNCNNNQYGLNDTEIGTISDGDVYTIRLYYDNGTPSDLSDDGAPIATYTDKLMKRPYLNTELSAASFPVITTSATAIATAASTGGDITINWTLPTGLIADQVHFWRSYADNSNDSVENEVSGTATGATLTLIAPSGTISGHGVNVMAIDVFGREIGTSINN